MLSRANYIKARNVNGLPFDPTRDEVDQHRIRVARDVKSAAEWAALCLLHREEDFEIEAETAALRWHYYTGRDGRESAKIWTHEVYVVHFHTHIRQFSLDGSGQLWSRRFLRDWQYRNDIIVSFPLGNITDCWFSTELLKGELLPALNKLAGV